VGEEAVHNSKCSEVRVKGDLNKGNTTNTTIEDEAQALSQMTKTTTTPKDILDTQKPSHEQIPPRPILSHDGSKKLTSALRYLCKSSQLFGNMTSTIQKAQEELGLSEVTERGFLILETTPLEESFAEFWRGCEMASAHIKVTQGFILEPHPSGYVKAFVDPSASIDLTSAPTLERASQSSPYPEQDFQDWVNQSRRHCTYLICDSLKEHKVNKIIDAGPLNRRP